MKKYEIVLLINQDVPHQGIAVIAKKIESLFDGGGKVVSSEYWGLRELAYPIVKQKKARYYMLSVEMNPDVVKVISDYIKINESIIRSGIYSVEEFDKESHMMSYTKGLAENLQESDFTSLFPNHVTVKTPLKESK
ncbi:MAG: small subunit ribosomal protein S6 [Candidatus Deianiraeaceae bacterium]|jgi:small subunit ribosomal protein S6